MAKKRAKIDSKAVREALATVRAGYWNPRGKGDKWACCDGRTLDLLERLKFEPPTNHPRHLKTHIVEFLESKLN